SDLPDPGTARAACGRPSPRAPSADSRSAPSSARTRRAPHRRDLDHLGPGVTHVHAERRPLVLLEMTGGDALPGRLHDVPRIERRAVRPDHLADVAALVDPHQEEAKLRNVVAPGLIARLHAVELAVVLPDERGGGHDVALRGPEAVEPEVVHVPAEHGL